MISTKTIRSLPALALVALLVACGGGGDDGGGAQAPVVSETTTGSAPNNANSFRNDWLVTFQSKPSATGYTGDIRYQACVKGTWRQTLKADATLRLTLQVYGRQVAVVDKIAGKKGADNVITFAGCADTFTKAIQPHYPTGSATIQVQAMDNRAAFPVDGYDVTIEWTVVML